MIYLAFHKATRNRFKAWLERMFGLALQGAVLALTLQLAASVTGAFSLVFGSLLAASALFPSSPILNELQISVIRAGFGFILTTLIVWFPANAGSFCGRSLYAVTTRVNLGDRGGIVSR
jgi:hypothetical protein